MRHLATLLFLMTNFAVCGLLSQLRWREGQLFYVLLTGLLCFLVILIHEAGHALAAQLYRRPILRFVAMPFELRFRPLRLRTAHRDPIRADIGGFVQYGGGREARAEQAVIAFAGPAANFLLAAAATALIAWLSMRAAAPDLPAIAPLDPAQTLEPARTLKPIPGTHFGHYLPSSEKVRQALAAPNPFPGRKPVGVILAEAFAALSIGTGIANLIPFRGSDGDVIADALFRRRART
jgi:hypothetical protein